MTFMFPYFQWKSVTVAYIILWIIVYILWYAFLYQKYEWNCVLYKWGAKYLPAIQRYFHIHRFILPIFLHLGTIHIIFNMLALLMLGNSWEHFMGSTKYAALLVFSGIGGNLFSAAIADKWGIAVGASTCIMGIMGFQIVWLITVWNQLGQLKYFYAFYIGFITLLMLFSGFSDGSGEVDSWGHIGGFLFGFLFTICFYETAAQHELLGKTKIYSMLCLIVLFGITTAFIIIRNTSSWRATVW